MVRLQDGEGLRSERLPARPAVVSREEVLDEARDVLAPLAERRDLDHVAEAGQQVGAKPPRLHVLLEGPVGGGDDQRVDPARDRVADPVELARIEEAQELRLQVRLDVAHLVEEQHAAVGQLQPTLLVPDRLGERPAHVAEQLRLDEIVG